MKLCRNLPLIILTLILICSFLPQTEVSATEIKEDYTTFEEAGASMREFMKRCDTGRLTLKFYVEDSRNLDVSQVYEMLREEACKHTGVSNEGDALVWLISQMGMDMTEEFDGSVHYITFRLENCRYNHNAEQG